MVALAETGAALAQAYPARTITLIVPFAAGGAADTTGRIMAEAILNQQSSSLRQFKERRRPGF